ncbi:hypothetical protein ANANG_G00318710 [Anguilla anguilla]|uniref:Uncharacterized protein n=1 Tax=Anguilla anguilla TaxID=7936 RepID=A0A9D3LHJ0_ANGAN|nr:hypothetical protein ANANG_G00318710 [Anguilla anguilla]
MHPPLQLLPPHQSLTPTLQMHKMPLLHPTHIHPPLLFHSAVTLSRTQQPLLHPPHIHSPLLFHSTLPLSRTQQTLLHPPHIHSPLLFHSTLPLSLSRTQQLLVNHPLAVETISFLTMILVASR